MSRRVNEPVVVRSSESTWPNMTGRDCCYGCAHVDPMCSQLDDSTHCVKHGRVTLPWWWCSDYLSRVEAELREAALGALGKPLMSLSEYLDARREVAEIGS